MSQCSVAKRFEIAVLTAIKGSRIGGGRGMGGHGRKVTTGVRSGSRPIQARCRRPWKKVGCYAGLACSVSRRDALATAGAKHGLAVLELYGRTLKKGRARRRARSLWRSAQGRAGSEPQSGAGRPRGYRWAVGDAERQTRPFTRMARHYGYSRALPDARCGAPVPYGH